MSSMESRRNASLDGLRGIAVILVLLHHHGLLKSGWLGVDVFFALSGFLITSILRRGRDAEDYWRPFWGKRATRILPPVLLVLLLTAALKFPLTLRDAAAYLLSFGDVLAYTKPDFETLRPLWSLAVEEHFYLLWPVAIRYCRRKTLLVILASLVLTEPLLRGVVSIHAHQWELTYFVTPFRLDGLALGACLALLMESVQAAERVRVWSLPAGCLLTFVWISLRLLLKAAFTRDNPTPTYNALCYSLVSAVCTCGLAYLLTHSRAWPVRLLATKQLAWLGLVSYGVYLYQEPMYEAIARAFPGFGAYTILVDLPVTVALAAFSYYLVELPTMRAGKRLLALRPERVSPPALPGVL